MRNLMKPNRISRCRWLASASEGKIKQSVKMFGTYVPALTATKSPGGTHSHVHIRGNPSAR